MTMAAESTDPLFAELNPPLTAEQAVVEADRYLECGGPEPEGRLGRGRGRPGFPQRAHRFARSAGGTNLGCRRTS
jgi:hypothetical protein